MEFETGKTYYTRSIGNHNCIFHITVAKRTAKTIVTTEGKRLRIRVWNDNEQVSPMGSYSMSPVISADKPLSDEQQETFATLVRLGDSEILAASTVVNLKNPIPEADGLVRDFYRSAYTS